MINVEKVYYVSIAIGRGLQMICNRANGRHTSDYISVDVYERAANGTVERVRDAPYLVVYEDFAQTKQERLLFFGLVNHEFAGLTETEMVLELVKLVFIRHPEFDKLFPTLEESLWYEMIVKAREQVTE